MSEAPPYDDRALADLRTADAVEQAARAVFGTVEPVRGVVHCLTVWRGPADCLVEVRPGPQAPHSNACDFLAAVARSRADAVLTHAHRLVTGTRRRAPVSAALLDRFRQRLGKRRQVVTLVLADDEIDLDHPLFRGASRVVVYTSRDGAWALESRAADRGVEIAVAAAPGVAGGLELLRREFGAVGVVLETGADTARPLYAEGGIDAVLLAVYEGTRLSATSEGPIFLPEETLGQDFERVGEPFRVRADAGDWSLYRWRRVDRNGSHQDS